ncbi:hypothetical protein JCM8547_005449 [Rhodosporidiobolus lusitaniae]
MSSTLAPDAPPVLPPIRHPSPLPLAAAPPPPDPQHPFPPPQHPPEHDGQDEAVQGNVTPAMAVRLSLLRRVWAGVVDMESPRRRRFLFFLFCGFAELVSLIVILALTYHDPCDRPLAPYLVMVCVRLALAFPISTYQHLNAPPGRNASAEMRQAWEHTRRTGNARMDHRVTRIRDLISLLSLILFLFGNYWLITEDTCHTTAPVLYKGALAALILSWLWTAEVLLYIFLVLFFLPFFLIGARWFGFGAAKNEIGPLSKADIEKLPKRLFVGTLPSDDGEPSTDTPAPLDSADSPNLSKPKAKTAIAATSSVSPSASTRSGPTRQWWRLWRRKADSFSSTEKGGSVQLGDFVAFPAGVEPVLLPETQNSCSICLCEYELPPLRSDIAAVEAWKPDEELLRLLPCKHAFHSGCLADWLAVSGRCPLCQRAVNELKGRKGRGNGGNGASAPPAAGGEGADARV